VKVRVKFPPFGEAVIEQIGGRSVVMPIALKDDSVWDLEFDYTSVEDDGTLVAQLSKITEVMPPITPQASGYGPEKRLREPWASDEAALRRREWAEIREKETACLT
jgi:hypothetical protein